MLQIVGEIAEGYRVVHAELRQLVESAPDGLLDWKPGPETNSIAVLIVHTLGSERQVWHVVTRTEHRRNRDEEFLTEGATKEDLLQLLTAADATVDRFAPRVTEQDLSELRERDDRSPQSGSRWLITNYAHAREHLAHAQLTAQLYSAH
ncbi:MAG: DinB family protein [Chloroflexi bacterium]|nr:DinB family protein [Chloroflexota bacterium]